MKHEKSLNNSVIKTFKILSAFSHAHPAVTLQEIVKATGINKTTAYRFLISLTELGIIIKDDETNTYKLGISLYELGNRVDVKSNIVDAAHQTLVALVNDIDITVHLAAIDNNEVFYLDKISSRKTFQMNTFIGARAPVYCTALGKSILAFRDTASIENYINTIEFHKLTKNTIINKNDFRKELRRIRKDGFAFDDEEFEEGLHCLAVPIFDADNYPAASISISGNPIEISGSNISLLQNKLKSAAKIISNRIYATINFNS